MEAAALDEKAIIFKVQYLHGKRRRRCDGHKREGECALPGEICWRATIGYAHRKVSGCASRSQQTA